ncbi:MAG: helix-turn-helix domain-containing protein [Prochlorotrichaceae cyanobacterium]|jgi:HTH-type transcriptional regulator/antitoxin HigA
MISPFLTITNESEYDAAVERLNTLLDEIGTNEKHPLYTFLDTLGILIHAYEEHHDPIPDIPDCSGLDILDFLMTEHELTPLDLPEIGTQEIISDILSGKRKLNMQQIRALSKRFNVSPAVFIP